MFWPLCGAVRCPHGHRPDSDWPDSDRPDSDLRRLPRPGGSRTAPESARIAPPQGRLGPGAQPALIRVRACRTHPSPGLPVGPAAALWLTRENPTDAQPGLTRVSSEGPGRRARAVSPSIPALPGAARPGGSRRSAPARAEAARPPATQSHCRLPTGSAPSWPKGPLQGRWTRNPPRRVVARISCTLCTFMLHIALCFLGMRR